MDQLRRVLATIRTYLADLSASQKLLVGSLGVITVMALFLVSQYAARPDMVTLLEGADAGSLSRAERILRTSGMSPRVDGSNLMVPATAQDLAVARLAEQRALPADQSEILFNNLIEKQTWKNSRQQNEQLYTIALQNQLARTISEFGTVNRASVVLDVPSPNGLGASTRRPTAAVTVWTTTGAVPQSTVDAVAELVAGARAGLEASSVRVVDGSTGRPMRPSSAEDLAASNQLDHAMKLEHETREKLLDLLSFIPGVQVAVSAQVDVTRHSSQTTSYLAEGKGTLNLIERETGKTESQQAEQRSGEPGVRSNQTADINRGSGTGTSLETSDDESSFQAFPGVTVEQVDDPRGMATHVAVSINVPRGFVAAQAFKPAGDGKEPEPPTEAEVRAKFPEIERTVRDLVIPHVRTMTSAQGLSEDQIDAQVSVAMIPVDVPTIVNASASAGLFGSGGGSGGMLGFGSGLIDKVVLVGLALFSMFLMLSMVRKASRHIELPTAEELVGIPKALQAGSDLIGEAEEGDTVMQGIEVGDEELENQKLLEQISELVQHEPGTAAGLIHRWIRSED